MEMLTLEAGDYSLVVAPGHGGSLSRFDWRGRPIFRPTCGSSILDTACFPLVPFSNRIAHGRFYDGDRAVRLAPNFPGGEHPHPMHGFGWQAEWQTVSADKNGAVIRHEYRAGEWPWSYFSEQHFELGERGLVHRLSVTNLGSTPMPAGLGFHPYFPRDAQTVYRGAHRAEWQTAADGLPASRDLCSLPIDWWQGQPVDRRAVDTVYEGRSGALTIDWPSDGIRLIIDPSDELSSTVVYTPANANFFCVEPVSHGTDAINRPVARDTLHWLLSGETFEVSVRYAAEHHKRTIPHER